MSINRVLAHIEREVAYTVLIYKNDASKVVATPAWGFSCKRLTINEESISVRLLLA